MRASGMPSTTVKKILTTSPMFEELGTIVTKVFSYDDR